MMEVDEQPRKMGPWIVGKTLGTGGFSKVKLGIHESTGERVALKMLKIDSMKSSIKKQVERELAAMAKVKHPNVLRLKDVVWEARYPKKNGVDTDKVILVVLEEAPMGELFEYLSYTGAFEEAIARTYFHMLIEGVEKCHASDVVHRDLKPENLLLGNDFVLKIADFGFSVIQEGGTMLTQCGTPGYMAPEMSSSMPYDARKTDLWACGVILFIMLSGFPPFITPDVSDWWFHKLKNKRHDLFWRAHCRTVYFSDGIKDLINKILSPDPSQRISLTDIKTHPWFIGPTISQSTLISELTRRKDTVQTEKAREKMVEKAKAQGAAVGSTAMHGVTAADRELGNEDFSDLPPTMEFFCHGIDGNKGAPADNAASMGDMMDFGGDMGMGDDFAVEGQAAEVSDAVCYTRFASKCTAEQLFQRLKTAISSHTQNFSCKDSVFKLKVKSILTSSGSISMSAQVFKDSKNDTRVVEFNRISGDGMQFRALFAQVREALKDVVLSSQGQQP